MDTNANENVKTVLSAIVSEMYHVFDFFKGFLLLLPFFAQNGEICSHVV